MKVLIKDVRGAFLSLFEAKTVGGEGDPRYSGAFVVEQGSANAKALAAALVAVAKEKWAAKADGVLKDLKSKGRVCYREEPLSKDGEVYEGFEGMHSLNASNKARPLVLDRDKTPLTAADGKPYSGSYMNVSLELWAQDNQYGKRINATLKGVQFVRDGDSFGGGAPASPDDFEDLAVGEDDLAG
jgi:outer membrane protein assembly factor BamB